MHVQHTPMSAPASWDTTLATICSTVIFPVAMNATETLGFICTTVSFRNAYVSRAATVPYTIAVENPSPYLICDGTHSATYVIVAMNSIMHPRVLTDLNPSLAYVGRFTAISRLPSMFGSSAFLFSPSLGLSSFERERIPFRGVGVSRRLIINLRAPRLDHWTIRFFFQPSSRMNPKG